MNNTFEVYNKIPDEERINWNLYIDAVYKADPSAQNMSGEVLSKLLGVKNQGGFRYLGKTDSPDLVILYSTGRDIYWRDELDNNMGLFLYYGDNKTPGNDLHQTNLHGNEILRYVFELASSEDIEIRKRIPPILVFKNTTGRDVQFLGLAVPGIKSKPSKDWLTAVWGSNHEGNRFQNYKAYFTILDTSNGSQFLPNESGINLAWINDIKVGKAFDSIYAPKRWKKYIVNRTYAPLIARKEKTSKKPSDQLPPAGEKMEMLIAIHDYFIQKDHGYSFEGFSKYLLEAMDASVVGLEVTRPYRDGGFDAIGRYRIFNNVESSVFVDFYMQAKCYKVDAGIKTTDTARLISRIKNRQFGVMISTTYIGDQAYKEIIEDGHPIVLITGKDIIDFIYDELEIRSANDLKKWLCSEAYLD